MQFSSPEQQVATENAVLAWAATSAVALSASQVVQSALVLLMQQRFNAAQPSFQADGYRGGRISEDGVWGRQSADAALRMLILPRTSNDSQYVSDMVAAFGASNAGIVAATPNGLRTRFPGIRDVVVAYSNRTEGVLRGLAGYGDGLRAAVANSPTTADAASRARTFLGAALQDTSTSQTTATVVSTRTVPTGFPEKVAQATQTPSGVPPIVTTTTSIQPVNVLADAAPIDVQGRPVTQGPNLKIIIPAAVAGGLLIVWLAASYSRKRAR
jgi:hypothetical protein